jgi:hypothetical protein
MSETRTPYTPQSLVNAHEDAQEREEQEFLRAVLRGLYMQEKALEAQRAGVCQQAAAIRKKLGIEEKRR